jgi:predicted DNA-binding protein (MmcQ/YjbR family)
MTGGRDARQSVETMSPQQFNAYCKSLPHTAYVMQWGGAHVWKVGGLKAGKVFAIAWFDDSKDAGITFKCSPMSFELLKESDGCRPAPYFASRGMKWIQRTSDASLSDSDLRIYLRESYRLAALNLTKKLQLEFGLR